MTSSVQHASRSENGIRLDTDNYDDTFRLCVFLHVAYQVNDASKKFKFLSKTRHE